MSLTKRRCQPPFQSLVIWIAVCGAPVLMAGCIFECSDEVIARAVSTDGRREAILRVRNCGATTPFQHRLIVSVPEKWWATDALTGALCIHKPEHVDLRWEGDDLVLTCKECCNSVRQKTEVVGKSRIRYEGI